MLRRSSLQSTQTETLVIAVPDDTFDVVPEHLDVRVFESSLTTPSLLKSEDGDMLLSDEEYRQTRTELNDILRAQKIAERITGTCTFLGRML